MSGVPEHFGLLRAALVGSLMIHLVLAMVPWSGFGEGGGEDLAMAGDFEVSLMPGLASSEVAAPGERVPEPEPDPIAVEPEPVAEPEPEPDSQPEPVESGSDDPEPVLEDAAAPPFAGASGVVAEGQVGQTPGEDSTGTPAAGLSAQPTPYRPPRLLAGALPIDPDDSEELNVPAEIPVRLRIGVDGTVKEIAPADPDLPPRVIEALELSARAMKFIPARRGGQLVEAWFHMTFIYRK